MRLLAILVGPASTPACLDAAVLAAGALRHAEIEALHVKVDPDQIVAASEEIEIQRLRELREGTAEERSEAVRSAFLAWTARTHVQAPAIHWKVRTGTEEEVVCREAEDADVVVLVLGREQNLDSSDALHTGVFYTGKPILLVPSNWRRGSRRTFTHVAVGLSNSEATRHAIEGAGPWLRAANRVTAIRIGDKGDAALGLSRLLTESGVEPELDIVRPGGGDIGAQIIAEANAVRADLLVVGAYRYPPVVEWLLGGTTRHLLAAANLPLLLAH